MAARAVALVLLLCSCGGERRDGGGSSNGNGAGGEADPTVVVTARALHSGAEPLAEALRAACAAVTVAVNDRSRPFRERAERAQAEIASYEDAAAAMSADPRLRGVAPDYQLLVVVARDYGVELHCPAFGSFFQLLASEG